MTIRFNTLKKIEPTCRQFDLIRFKLHGNLNVCRHDMAICRQKKKKDST